MLLLECVIETGQAYGMKTAQKFSALPINNQVFKRTAAETLLFTCQMFVI